MAKAVGIFSGDRLLGLVFILLVSVIWVVASFIVQGIESIGVQPVVITFISNSLFALYFPVYWGLEYMRSRATEEENSSSWLEKLRHLSPTGISQFLFSHRLFRAACLVAPLWFIAQFTFNASLSMTSVTSNTILSSASSLFTFLFSVVLLSERFTYFKLGCIVALMLGTAMVTMADAHPSTTPHSDSHSMLGDILCLVSSIVYGMYTVTIRMQIPENDKDVPMTLFFGIMGSLILSIVGPVLGFLLMGGVSLGTLTWSGFGIVILKGLLDNVISDYLWARAILLVGPTLATSGLALQVPLAVVLDALIKHPVWMQSVGTALLTFVGGAIILAAFFGLNANEYREEIVDRMDDNEAVPLSPIAT